MEQRPECQPDDHKPLGQGPDRRLQSRWTQEILGPRRKGPSGLDAAGSPCAARGDRKSRAALHQGLGAATAKQIKNHFTRSRYPELEAVLEQLEADRTILRLELEGAEDAWHKSGPWFMHREDLPLLEKIKNGGWQGRTTLLSPFDNMIADRERTELLWDFFFRIEIYVPPHKREYGYYVMPILHEDRLIGRIDPKMDRKTGILHIQSVHKEPEVHTSADMLRSVRAAIDDLAAFLNAGEVLFSDHLPAEWKGIAE